MSLNNNQTSKAFPYSSFMPFYVNGLGISNDATTPNTKLDLAPGTCLDSTGTFQISLNSPVVIDATQNGINGLDTGTLAASKVYAVYLVTDQVTALPSGAMISLAYGSKTPNTPVLPFGYNTYRLVGFVATDSMAHFLLGYWSNNDTSRRLFVFDAFQATAVTTGASTSYAHVDLSALVPLVNNLNVSIYSNFNANGAGDTLSMQGGASTGDQVIITAPVAGGTAHTTTISSVLAQTVSLTGTPSPVINYKVSSGSDAVAIDVAGYTFDL